MHNPSRRIRVAAFTLASLFLLPLAALPVSAEAATIRDYPRFSSSRSSSSTYGRISSSIRSKINKLDDDEVDNLSIPVALGVTVAKLWPNFGDPRDGGEREHEGLDIMAPEGSFIASPTDAVVTRTGKGDSAGIYVYTAAPGGETFAYMHLSRIADGVKAGTVLKPGDLIGYVGTTGNAAGGAPHLHFEIRDGREPTDPFPRLTKEFAPAERIRTLQAVLKELQDQLDD